MTYNLNQYSTYFLMRMRYPLTFNNFYQSISLTVENLGHEWIKKILFGEFLH